MKVTILDYRISALVPREQQPTLWSHPLPTSTCGSPWCLCPTNWKKIIIPKADSSSWGKLASFPGSCPGKEASLPHDEESAHTQEPGNEARDDPEQAVFIALISLLHILTSQVG